MDLQNCETDNIFPIRVMSFCFCASWFFQNYFFGYSDVKLSSVGLNHRMFSPLLDIDHNCCNFKEALMWTQAHLSLWWSRLCSSWCLFHRHCVLVKSSTRAFKLVWVTKAGKPWSPKGLCGSDRSAAPSHLVHGCGSFSNSKVIVFFLVFHVSYSPNTASVVGPTAEVSFFPSLWRDGNNRYSVPLPSFYCHYATESQNTKTRWQPW